MAIKETLEFALSIKADSTSTAKSVREIQSIIKELDLLRQKEGLTEESTEDLSNAYAHLDKQLEEIRKQTKVTDAGFDKLIGTQRQLLGAQQRANVATQDYTKTTSNANQVLFSFGDTINDSAQFQFGFAQGARAIGNNISFATEQLVNLTRKTGGLKSGLQALIGSFMGPAGILVAINLVITGLTVFGDKIFSTKESVEELDEEVLATSKNVDKLVKALERAGLINKDAFGINLLEEEKKIIQENIDALSKYEDIEARIKELRIESLRLSNEAIHSSEEELSVINKRSIEISNELKLLEAVVKNNEDIPDLLIAQRQRVKEINQELRIQRAIQEEVERQQIARAKALADQNARIQELRPDINVDAVAEFEVLDVPELELDPLKIPIEYFVAEGSLQFALNELASLQTQFNLATTEEERKAYAERIKLKQEEIDAKKGIIKQEEAFSMQSLNAIASASRTIIGGMFGESKLASVATAIIDGIVAVQKTYSSVPYPFNLPLAGAMGALALKNIANIKSTNIGSSSPTALSSTSTSSVKGGISTSDYTGSKNSLYTSSTPSQSFQPVNNIYLSGEFDPEVLSVKVEKGDNIRVRNTSFIQ